VFGWQGAHDPAGIGAAWQARLRIATSSKTARGGARQGRQDATSYRDARIRHEWHGRNR
jgi:hypothetical protein